MHRVRAGDDAALRRPEDRVIVVRARGDVDEEVEHRVVVHERRGDGHGAGRHGEGVLSASLVGQVERVAVLVGDCQRFERIALIGRDGDGHSAALGGRLRADSHTAVRAVRDRNVIARRGGDRCVDFLPFRRQGQIFCHRRVKVPFCIAVIPAHKTVARLDWCIRCAGLVLHHLHGVLAASIHEGHYAAFSDIASLQFVVERAAGNISGSRVADFFDCDRPVEAAAGDYTLSISDSHRAVIASAGDRDTGGIHPAGVFHS